ncbi:MAG TPA: tetratricopeptide repeat protein [Desulfobacteraceae bacterium]|nr:tetratricopeptide repeat protein [Desulfobacteraceae bacterium]
MPTLRKKKPSFIVVLFRRIVLLLVIASCAAAAWWGWRMIQGESVRLSFMLMEINGERSKILRGETLLLNPFDTIRIVEVGASVPFDYGIRLEAEGVDVDSLRHQEMQLVDLLPGREAFVRYRFNVSVRYRDRSIGDVTWKVEPSVEDWLERANRLINDEMRVDFLERAVQFTSGDRRIERRLLNEYKQTSRWRKTLDLLKKMAADTPDTALYAELLEVYRGLQDLRGVQSVLRILVEREPRNPKWKLSLGEVLEEAGEKREAAEYFEAALDLSDEGERPDLYKHLGYLYTEIEEYSKAVEKYAEAVRLDQKDANLHYNLAFLYDRLGNSDRAEFHLENAVTLESRDVEGRLTLARRLIDRGEGKKAEEYIKEVLARSPDNLEALLLMAGIAERGDRKRDLLDLYRRIHNLDPKNQTIIYNLGVLFYEFGEYRDSAGWLARYADTHPEDLPVHEMLFDCYLKSGKKDEAFKAAQHILDLKPDLLYPYSYIVDYLGDKGKFRRIIEILEPAVESHPDSTELKRNLMAAYTQAGETRAAVNLGEELIKDSPGDRNLLEFLFDGHRSLNDDESALKTAEALASLDVVDDDVYGFIFDQLSAGEKFERIASIMEDAVQKAPERARLREYLVVAYLNTGNDAGAARQMEEIVRLRPDDIAMLLNLAKLQEKRGKYTEALDAYRQAVTLYPDNEEAAEGYLRTRLKGVGGD